MMHKTVTTEQAIKKVTEWLSLVFAAKDLKTSDDNTRLSFRFKSIDVSMSFIKKDAGIKTDIKIKNSEDCDHLSSCLIKNSEALDDLLTDLLYALTSLADLNDEKKTFRDREAAILDQLSLASARCSGMPWLGIKYSNGIQIRWTVTRDKSVSSMSFKEFDLTWTVKIESSKDGIILSALGQTFKTSIDADWQSVIDSITSSAFRLSKNNVRTVSHADQDH